MFTRKHYRAIAEIIKNARRSQNNGASPDILLTQIESQIADCFKQDNSRFDRIKFSAACTADEISVCKAQIRHDITNRLIYG